MTSDPESAPAAAPAAPKSGMLDSNEQQTYTGMLDDQLAQKIAAGGTGLADVIARQLSRNLPTPAGATPTTPAAPGAPVSVHAAAALSGAAVAPALPKPQAAPERGAAGPAAPTHVLNQIRAAAAVRGNP